MNEKRKQLIKELLYIIGDYNMSQGLVMNVEHVKKWIQQFDEEYRDIILSELIHILKKTYFSRVDVKKYIKSMLTSKKVFGEDIKNNIKNTTFLKIQREGNSQNDLLEIVQEILLEEYNLKLEDCKSETRYFYIDDCIFTGNKFRYDIKEWLEKNEIKKGSELITYHIAVYKQGEKYVGSILEEMASNKNIQLNRWYHIEYNNYKNNIFDNPIDVLFPQKIQHESVQEYIEDRLKKSEYAKRTKYFRDFDLKNENLCSSQYARKCLEGEFLKVGADLVMRARNYKDSVRPMGFQKLESIGFGSMFITYRNISNNCPLALWYGDVTKGDYTPLGTWYPLFPRVTSGNSENERKSDFFELAQLLENY